MADISPPSFFSPLQLFGLLAVLGAKTGIKDQCVESFVQTQRSRKRKKRRKKEKKEKNTRNREKASHWYQSNLFAFPINQIVRIFSGFFKKKISKSEIPTSQNQKNPQKTKPRFEILFFVLYRFPPRSSLFWVCSIQEWLLCSAFEARTLSVKEIKRAKERGIEGF